MSQPYPNALTLKRCCISSTRPPLRCETSATLITVLMMASRYKNGIDVKNIASLASGSWQWFPTRNMFANSMSEVRSTKATVCWTTFLLVNSFLTTIAHSQQRFNQWLSTEDLSLASGTEPHWSLDTDLMRHLMCQDRGILVSGRRHSAVRMTTHR